MEYTKNKLLKIAIDTCLPALNRAQERLECHSGGLSIDRAGYACSELENICRPFLGIVPAALLSEETISVTVKGVSVPVEGWIKSVLISGCKKENPYGFERGRECCGDNFFYNQSITELSLLLVSFYLARERFWDSIELEQRKELAEVMLSWSEQALSDSWPNNHLWFPVLALTVLKKFGYECLDFEEKIEEALETLDQMYLGDGWYQDGEFGRFDYYISWSHHVYPLLWTLIEDSSMCSYERRKSEYIRRAECYIPYYMHFFDANGANVLYGRSLSYRFAASALFAVGALAGCVFSYGAAKKIMFQNIGYYMEHMETVDGVMTPGILYQNPSFVESYTSDGGAYWAAKTFWALFIPNEHPFWSKKTEDYPIEKGDYMVRPELKTIRMVLEGNRRYSGVTLYNNTANYCQNHKFIHHFNDMGGYYSKFAYNSRAGFAVSCRDIVSFDNMISLGTEDGTMYSHRMGFTDLGERDGVFYSVHQPFGNDPGTQITTALIPLNGGIHVRIHKVVLAGAYVVREGGFCIPFYEDNYRAQERPEMLHQMFEVYTPLLNSKLYYLGEVPVHCYMELPKPGNHALAPLAGYPAYETEIMDAGVYYFAAIFSISGQDSRKLSNFHYTRNGEQVLMESDEQIWKLDL